MGKTLQELRRVREVANRLNLGASAEARYLRSVVVELINVLTGDEDQRHPDIEQSGALHPPPDLLPAAVPARGPRAQEPAHAPYVPAPRPVRALTLEEAMAGHKKPEPSGLAGGPGPSAATKPD